MTFRAPPCTFHCDCRGVLNDIVVKYYFISLTDSCFWHTLEDYAPNVSVKPAAFIPPFSEYFEKRVTILDDQKDGCNKPFHNVGIYTYISIQTA